MSLNMRAPSNIFLRSLQQHWTFTSLKRPSPKKMSVIIYAISTACLFPLLIILVTFLLNKKATPNFEKATPFECGFDPHNSARIPFSLRFFILAVLFLVFDIEVALLIPVPSLITLTWEIKLTIIIFAVILLGGLYHEWNEKSLEWK